MHMLGLKSSDRMYNSLPLYHTAGGVVGTGAALVDGIPSVLRAKFSASNFWADCIKYECTVRDFWKLSVKYISHKKYRFQPNLCIFCQMVWGIWGPVLMYCLIFLSSTFWSMKSPSAYK